MTRDPLPHCELSDELQVKAEIMLMGDVKAITPVVDYVMAVVDEMGCAAGEEDGVELALREALANAIRHGSRHDPTKRVQCTVACDPSAGLLLIVRDEGPGFDPASLENPTLGQNVFSSHGRGIFLINQLMDDVRFERGGTEIRMRKKRP